LIENHSAEWKSVDVTCSLPWFHSSLGVGS
jgi:hypothetical protein